MEEKKKLGFWDFVDKHPIITFILGTCLIDGVVTIVKSTLGSNKRD